MSDATEPGSLIQSVPEEEAAAQAGLRYVSDDEPGLTRRRAGKGFAYVDAKGKPVRDVATLDRIRKLAIPPAYTDVWICADPEGHIQATGRDARGRKQYRYHPRWSEVRDADKYGRMIAFGTLLPKLRTRIDAHMRREGLGRRKVLATVAHLLDTTLIRVGNEDYAKANKSYGLTTLRNRHVDIAPGALRFEFKGKSGKAWRLQVRDRRIARIVRQIQELPGQQLFQYIDRTGKKRAVTSADVNAYLRDVTGEAITAKEFRTWAGTVLAAMALAELEGFESPTAAKKNVKQAIDRVSARLGNTPTICRKCYVHPQVLEAYMDGALAADMRAQIAGGARRKPLRLSADEAAVLAMLRKRLESAPQKKPRRRKAPPNLRTQMERAAAAT
ncbi:MAG: topoisomerase [Hyphomicrobiales bacterium]|nr:topoisomerase [Hyphomicrobiales bacterium]